MNKNPEFFNSVNNENNENNQENTQTIPNNDYVDNFKLKKVPK